MFDTKTQQELYILNLKYTVGGVFHVSFDRCLQVQGHVSTEEKEISARPGFHNYG